MRPRGRGGDLGMLYCTTTATAPPPAGLGGQLFATGGEVKVEVLRGATAAFTQ